jgi:hypothetical protein
LLSTFHVPGWLYSCSATWKQRLMHDICLYGLNPGSIPLVKTCENTWHALAGLSHLSDNSYNQATITDHHRPSLQTASGWSTCWPVRRSSSTRPGDSWRTWPCKGTRHTPTKIRTHADRMRIKHAHTNTHTQSHTYIIIYTQMHIHHVIYNVW